MFVRCAHCHEPSEVAEESDFGMLVCAACGGRFSLVGEPTLTYSAGQTRKLGRFELLAQVGVGSFGSVWKAHDAELDRIVAVKVPREGRLAQTEAEQFLREARAAAQLHHPHIVGVHEVGREGDTVYIVSDFIQGATLDEWLTGRGITPREAARLGATIADALEHAHRAGVIHRDLKPSNIMLDAEGQPYLMDFGLARRQRGEATMTVEGRLLGTPAYMSPEQARGEAHQADCRSDVYSLGVVLFRLLTGELPFRGNAQMLILQILREDPPRPRLLDARIPRDMETIVLKCLAKAPSARYATAQELGDDLRRFLKGEPIRARPVNVVERGARWVKRRPAVAALLAMSGVAACSLVGALVALAFHSRLETAFHETDVARKTAEAQSRRAEKALLQSERMRYFLHIARAHAEWRDGNMSRVEPLLDACPPAARNWEWRYLKRLCHEDLLTIQGHAQPNVVPDAAFHPDGKRLAAPGPDGTVRILDLATGVAARTYVGHTGEVICVAFDAAGARLASAATDQTVRIWSVESGDEVLRIDAKIGFRGGVAFSPDGESIAFGGFDPAVQVWNASTGEVRLRLEGHTDQISSVAFSPDGAKIATGSFDFSVKLWDAKTGELMQTLAGHSGWVRRVAFNHDGTRLASASIDRTLKVWDTATGQAVATFKGHPGGVLSAAFSPDGQRLASGGFDQTVRLWEIASGEELATFRGHWSAVTGVAFSPDGSRLASISDDQTVKLWDPQRETLGRVLKGHENHVNVVAFHPNGQRLASASRDHSVRIWRLDAGREERRLTGHADAIYDVAYSPDGTRLASVSKDVTCKLWDAATGEEIASIPHPSNPVTCVAFDPRPEMRGQLALGSRDGDIVVWNAEEKTVVGAFRGHSQGVHDAAFSPNGKWLASASEDHTVKLWNTQTGECVRTLKGHTSGVWSLAFSPDGRRLVSGGWDNVAKLWDVETGIERNALSGHAATVLGAAFSPDGTRIATASFDGTVKLWDSQSGHELLTLKEHTAEVKTVAFSPNGNWLASGSGDGQIRLWDGR